MGRGRTHLHHNEKAGPDVDRIHQQPPEPTPVTDDATATPEQLLDRAADDYATGWGRPESPTGNKPGSAA